MHDMCMHNIILNLSNIFIYLHGLLTRKTTLSLDIIYYDKNASVEIIYSYQSVFIRFGRHQNIFIFLHGV